MNALGIDLVSLSRIEPWVRDSMMLEKVFTDNEILYCLKKRCPQKFLAAFFAAKEAVMKALGTGWGGGVEWKDIEVINENDAFSIKLYNKARELCINKKIFVSVSCADTLAIAAVVISPA